MAFKPLNACTADCNFRCVLLGIEFERMTVFAFKRPANFSMTMFDFDFRPAGVFCDSACAGKNHESTAAANATLQFAEYQYGVLKAWRGQQVKPVNSNPDKCT